MLQTRSKISSFRSVDDQEVFNAMKALFASLSEDELDALEDDLNFCRFTGLPSERLLETMKRVDQLPADISARLNATVAA